MTTQSPPPKKQWILTNLHGRQIGKPYDSIHYADMDGYLLLGMGKFRVLSLEEFKKLP